MSSRPTLRESPSSPTPMGHCKAHPVADPTSIPDPVGPLTHAVVQALTSSGSRAALDVAAVGDVRDPITDQDLQLALWMLYELHYRGFRDVEDEAEWDPDLLAARLALEAPFEEAVRELVDLPDPVPVTPAEIALELTRQTIATSEPELAAFLARDASSEQFEAYLVERAVYHLRESDAQTLLLARIGGPAKTALGEILYDELGAGRADRLHADLFARGLTDLGLSTDVGAYAAVADATTLASVNLASMFNLHRRLRGAAAGHFAAFEATSSIPCRLIAEGAERLDLPPSVADYYHEHVEADSVHEQVATNDLCGGLVAAEPGLAADIVFGAGACLAVDGLAGEVLLERLRDQSPGDDQVAS